ncbi:MAG: hypothetical protein HC854_06290 [Flavobacterium sp.]|nr:hypothetical protein [Flavobacterium sp.]
MVFEFHNLDEKHLVLYDFLKRCAENFDLVHLEVNPSGGFSKDKQPKNIEVTLERKM